MGAVFRPVKRGWLAFVRWFGTVQMVILLTFTYFVMVTPVYPFIRFISDPLRLRAPKASNWQPRAATPSVEVYLKRQF